MTERTDLKKCAICQQWYPATTEWFSPNGKNKLYSHCKQCRNLINRGHLIVLNFECQEGHKRCSQCQQCIPATKEFFAPDRRCADGFQSACRACQKSWEKHFNETHPGHEAKLAREWYHKNKERALANRKRWYKANPTKVYERKRRYRLANLERKREWDLRWRQANPDKVRESGKKFREKNPEYLRQYYQANREKAREYRRLYREQNRERLLEVSRNYVKTHPDVFRVLKHRRKARKASLPDSFTIEDWQRALDYFGSCCAVCGRKPDEVTILAPDHWIAIRDQRPDNPGSVPWNIVPLCHCRKNGINGCNNSKRDSNAERWLIRRLGEEKAVLKLAEIRTYFDWVQRQVER